MNLREAVDSIFSGLSSLYPKEYQKDYSDDMKSVFRDILDDTGGSGNGHVLRALLKEFACLPGCLVREYLSIPEGGTVKTSRQILNATLIGFLSLFFLFAVERILYRVLLTQNWIDVRGMFLLELIIDGAISGILAGGAIGYALSIKNKVPMMAVCGAAFIAGRLLTGPPYWDMLGISTQWVTSEWQVLLMLAASPVTGLLVGILAGLLWKGWKTGIVFGLASSLIFTLGLLGQFFFWYVLFNHGMPQILDPEFMSPTLRLFIGTLISYSILGGIVGILWGVLLDRLPRMKSLKLSLTGV
jgi:hypothetical protein